MFDPNRYRDAAAHDPFRRRIILLPHRVALAIDALIVIALVAILLATHLGPGVLGYLAIGVGIGIATCIPIGIANVIVIDAAYRHGVRRAVGAAIGGALADGIYASLGIFGMGPLIESYPIVPALLHAVSSFVLLGYGLILLRARPTLVGAPTAHAARSDGQLAGGFVVGLAGTLLNPSAVVTWVVIVGGHATGIARTEAAAWVAGIVVGTFAWFLVVAFLTLRGRRVLRDKSVWLTRGVGAVVIASGIYSLYRVLALVVSGS